INIITKKESAGKIRPAATVSYGSYQTFRTAIGVSGKCKKFTYNLNYNHTGSKGFSAAADSTRMGNFDPDGFGQNNLQANLKYALGARLSIAALSTYGRYTSDLDAG